MSRWTVYKAGRYAWTSHLEGELPGELFPTWRMAQDYADRMARTREVVLPRQPLPLSLPGEDGDEPITVTRDEEDGCVCLTDESDGEVVSLYPHELRPLALVLYALAEQEEQCEK